MINEEVIKPDLYEILKECVSDGLGYVKSAVQEKKYISKHHDFPKMEIDDTGFPSFSIYYSSEEHLQPFNYKSIFGDGEYDFISPSKIESWNKFKSFFRNNERILYHYQTGNITLKRVVESYNDFYPNDSEKMLQVLDNVEVFGIIEDLIEGYIHLNKSFDFSEIPFLPLYKDWENSVFQKKLEYEIVVPIISLKFSFESLDLGNGFFIEKMSNSIQLSRVNDRGAVILSNNKYVIKNATHALVIRKNFLIENENQSDRDNALYEFSTFSTHIKLVNYFFSCLNAITKADSGYGQLLVRSVNWTRGYIKAFLPTLYILSLRAYPDFFESDINKFKLRPTIDEETAKKVGTLLSNIFHLKEKLKGKSENTIDVALERLNSSFLKKDKDDSILDVTMGLEALLVSEKTEITHRLALRMATLCNLHPFEKYTPLEVFRFTKKVYDYRSKFTHSSLKEINKFKSISLPDNSSIPTIVMGINLLSHAIKVISENPEFLEDISKIDEYLLNLIIPIVDSHENISV